MPGKTVLYRGYAHILCIGSKAHFLQKEAATRIGIAAFLFLLLMPVYTLEGYWTARVRGEFESLVTCRFRFGNEDSGSASQRVSGTAAEKGLCFRTLPHRTRKDAAPTVVNWSSSKKHRVCHPPEPTVVNWFRVQEA